MFDGKRYGTAGINATVDHGIQLFIWNIIEELKSRTQLDYLQVFDLTKVLLFGRFVQKIVHSQEIPHHRQEYIINTINPVDAKIYVIDDEAYSTMILAEEY